MIHALKKNIQPDPIAIDIPDVQITDDGIKDFYWPVSQEELHTLRDTLLMETRTFVLNAYEGESAKEAKVLHITYIEIIREFLMMLRSSLLHERAQNDGKEINASKEFYPYLNALQSGDDLRPIVASRLAYASHNVPQPSKAIKVIRALKLLAGHPVYTRKPLGKISPDDIVTFSTSTFMERHARKVEQETGRRVVLCSLWEWFQIAPGSLKVHMSTARELSALEKSYLAMIKAIAQKAGYTVPDAIWTALESFVATINTAAEFYWAHLLKPQNKKHLPPTLWFGSNNPLQQRILRAAVQENGGHTVGHDHGRGLLMGICRGELGTVYDFCDEFIAYSDFLANNGDKIQTQRAQYTPAVKPVIFTGFSSLFMKPQDIQTYQKKLKLLPKSQKNEQKTAMYICGIFKAEQIAGLNVLPSDIASFDFQIRLIHAMQAQGYKVILKTHPEAKINLPDSLRTMDNIEITGGYVEDYLYDVDMLMFDFISSAFKTLALTDKPMMYFDFGISDIPDDVQTHLEQRISVVPSHFDHDNRMQIEWEKLSEKAENALEKSHIDTQGFLEILYGATS